MDVITRVNELLVKGESFCLATVIESQDSALKVGLKFIMRANGKVDSGDTLLLEMSVREIAMIALKEKGCRIIELPGGVNVFLEVFAPENSLIVCGAGHIAIPLSRT